METYLKKYIEDKVAIDKVLAIWKAKNYAPDSFYKFLQSKLIKDLLLAEDDNLKRCILGYILQQQQDLNDGRRQQYISDYLRYINEKQGGNHV